MADTTEFTGTQQTQQGTGLIPQAGQFLSNVQQSPALKIFCFFFSIKK